MDRPAPRLTLAEWAALPEDEPGELHDEHLTEEEGADRDHEDVVAWLILALGGWIRARGGRIYASDGKYAVAPGVGRKADVSAFFPGTNLPPRHGPWTTPPDIMVEVVSPTPRDGRRDRVEKLGEYAAFGVRFYWIVDPQLRTFEVHELDPRRKAASAAAGGLSEDGWLPNYGNIACSRSVLWG
jgi:Uma2 family endonuclease